QSFSGLGTNGGQTERGAAPPCSAVIMAASRAPDHAPCPSPPYAAPIGRLSCAASVVPRIFAVTDHAPAASTPAPVPGDDLAAAFQIEGWPVRGRLVRLGETIDTILSAHDYPEPVAALLGEACALAALVGSSLKFEGRLIVQAQGDGPVRYVVADYDTEGHLRGYCRFDPDEVAAASQGFARPGAKALLGQGVFVMTLDRGADFERTQGITPIEGESLSLCAET